MHEKLRFALRRSVTMSNLLESLQGVFGDREAFLLPEPLGYGRFPHDSLTYGDGVLFTNLVAEALIRDMDLKKGQRVLLFSPHPTHLLLLAVAVIKGGGVAVPLDHRLPPAEIGIRAAGCRAGLAIIDGRILEAQADTEAFLPGVQRLIISGPRDLVPEGLLSLEEAMAKSSGFFLPYTLKRSSVVGLFHSRGSEGSSLAVMATNQGLLGIRHAAALVLHTAKGRTCACALPLTSLAGFSSAVLGLCMGLRMFLAPGDVPEHALEAVRDSRAAVFIGDGALYGDMLAAGGAKHHLSSVSLWLGAACTMSREHVDALRRLGSLELGPLRLPAFFCQICSVGEYTTFIAMKPFLPGLGWRQGGLGVPLPPNRIRVLGENGKRVGRGGQGELAIKGPGATPGYWNDIDRTYRSIRGGWLHTGIRARKSFLSAAVVAGNPDRA